MASTTTATTTAATTATTGAGGDAGAAGVKQSAATVATVQAGKATPIKNTRSIVQKVLSVEQGEGMGARVRRSIGRHELRNLDPFLMLDEFNVKHPAGFPDHPHRGFETVTYMLDGTFEHEDFCGHQGKIGPGDLQWMTAGKGIVHAEMPVGDKVGHGLQLWVNLKAKDKMVEPAYQELLAKDIPKVTHDGVTATVIAGSVFGVDSPVYTRTPTCYLDFKMEAGSSLQQPIPAGWNGFVYILQGKASFGPSKTATETDAHHTLVLSNEKDQDGLQVTASKEGCHFVLICGEPTGEPVVQHGPFVMNTREEIMAAMMDYQSNRNGFEKARGFESSISKRSLMYR